MTDEELKSLFDALRRESAAMRQENTRDFATMREETTREFAAIRQENTAAHVETRRTFGVVADGVRKEVRLVAEAVAQLEEKVERENEEIREEMHQGFADTQAMIKFSHAELDRRMNFLERSQHNLEETVTDLQARVERLESSTH